MMFPLGEEEADRFIDLLGRHGVEIGSEKYISSLPKDLERAPPLAFLLAYAYKLENEALICPTDNSTDCPRSSKFSEEAAEEYILRKDAALQAKADALKQRAFNFKSRRRCLFFWKRMNAFSKAYLQDKDAAVNPACLKHFQNCVKDLIRRMIKYAVLAIKDRQGSAKKRILVKMETIKNVWEAIRFEPSISLEAAAACEMLPFKNDCTHDHKGE